MKISPFQISKLSTHNAHTPSVQLPNYEITTLSHRTHMKILQFKSAQKEKFNNLIAYHILTLLDFIPCVCEISSFYVHWWENLIPSLIFGFRRVRIYFSPVDITQHSMFFACTHRRRRLLQFNYSLSREISFWKRSRHAFKHEIPKNCDMWRAIIRKKTHEKKSHMQNGQFASNLRRCVLLKATHMDNQKNFSYLMLRVKKKLSDALQSRLWIGKKVHHLLSGDNKAIFLTEKSITANWIENISMCVTPHIIFWSDFRGGLRKQFSLEFSFANEGLNCISMGSIIMT